MEHFMQTSRFQLGLIAFLSVALGVTLSSSEAIGYPAGAAVSTGNNPIVSATGTMNLGGSPTDLAVISAPDTHDLVITDILAGLNQNSDYCDANGEMVLSDAEGEHYARIPVYMTNIDNAHPTATSYSPSSGIMVPAGRSISVSWNFDSRQCGTHDYNLRYNIAGYLAHP
jgi:hypothetical protein